MSKRVLIVDDEKNMRWVLGQALSAEGFPDSHLYRTRHANPGSAGTV